MTIKGYISYVQTGSAGTLSYHQSARSEVQGILRNRLWPLSCFSGRKKVVENGDNGVSFMLCNRSLAASNVVIIIIIIKLQQSTNHHYTQTILN